LRVEESQFAMILLWRQPNEDELAGVKPGSRLALPESENGAALIQLKRRFCSRIVEVHFIQRTTAVPLWKALYA